MKTLAIYQEGSNTIRKVPENYCLIAFREDEKGIRAMYDVDGATYPYRQACKRAYDKYLALGETNYHILAELVDKELQKVVIKGRYWEDGKLKFELYYKLVTLNPIDPETCSLKIDHLIMTSENREWQKFIIPVMLESLEVQPSIIDEGQFVTIIRVVVQVSAPDNSDMTLEEIVKFDYYTIEVGTFTISVKPCHMNIYTSRN